MQKIEVLPYLVDPHVHCRTPGQEEKEDFLTASRAALAGGVLTFMDMPNNSRLVTSREDIREKQQLAGRQIGMDVGFHLGTLGEADQDFAKAIPYVTGLKVYMNNTTGGYMVNDPDKLNHIFRSWETDKPVLVHAEGDTLKDAVKLAKEYQRRLYVCHISQESELELVDRAKQAGQDIFAEVTPHHLFLTDYGFDPLRKMLPPLSKFSDKAALWKGMLNGTIDVIGTDHAPHTLEEKAGDHPPHGVPGLETTLLMMLAAQRQGWIGLEDIIRLTHTNPINIFRLEEQPNSKVYVDREVDPYPIRGEDLYTKSRWTPFENIIVKDRVEAVTLRGEVVYLNEQVLAKPGSGRVLLPAT